MTLLDLGRALMAVVPNCYHLEALEQTDKYIVWAEDGQADSGHADNRMTTQIISGTMDYYTKMEFDPNVQRIQAALNALHIAWRLNSIQYEDETGYQHYEWTFEMAVNPCGENEN